MLDRKLEALRAEALRKLEQEKQNRNAKQAELIAEQAKLDAAESASSGQLLRAQSPLPASGVCPTCWVWDGEQIPLNARNSRSNDYDLFRCPRCGQEIEVKVPG